MFSFLSRKKNQERAFDPRQEVERLIEISPPSAVVTLMQQDGRHGANEDLGRAFFLRRDKKLYTEGTCIYITSPDNLKIARDQGLNSRVISLQFFNRRVPYKLECRVVGRFRLLPEIVETLDFSAKAAFKLSLNSSVRKQDKRQFYRYTLKNYGDSRIPLTTHITFEAFLKATNKEFPVEGAPPTLINDLQARAFRTGTASQAFTTRDAINVFREAMLKKQPHERSVAVTKVQRDESSGMLRRKDEQLLLGDISILGLEMESLRDVLYLKKSAKAGVRKGKDNPYNLHPGEKILTNYVHDKKYYQMVCEVMEARTQNEVVRPLEYPVEEPGLKVDLIDYSVGGALIEGSPELLKFLLGDKCPPRVDQEIEFSGTVWEKMFEDLRRSMVHLTFYPKQHFPDALKRFQPELPFKIRVIGQIVRTFVRQVGERQVLQHGIQLAYEPQGVPLKEDEIVDWRWSRGVRDNEYFVKIHSSLSQLYGYLETQSLSAGSAPRARRTKTE
jgi:hypothetical protein